MSIFSNNLSDNQRTAFSKVLGEFILKSTADSLENFLVHEGNHLLMDSSFSDDYILGGNTLYVSIVDTESKNIAKCEFRFDMSVNSDNILDYTKRKFTEFYADDMNLLSTGDRLIRLFKKDGLYYTFSEEEYEIKINDRIEFEDSGNKYQVTFIDPIYMVAVFKKVD